MRVCTLQRLAEVSHDIMTSIVVHGGTQHLLELVQAGMNKVRCHQTHQECAYRYQASVIKAKHITANITSLGTSLQFASSQPQSIVTYTSTPFAALT